VTGHQSQNNGTSCLHAYDTSAKVHFYHLQLPKREYIIDASRRTWLTMMSLPDTSMDWCVQAKEMLVEAGASPQAAVLGGATIAGFFAAACRCDREG